MSDKKEIEKHIAALELMNKEIPAEKFPEGSIIYFDFPDDETALLSCLWYKLTRGWGNSSIVRPTDKWQNVDGHACIELCERFDNYIIGVLGKGYFDKYGGLRKYLEKSSDDQFIQMLDKKGIT
jgi:hypothetical protein